MLRSTAVRGSALLIGALCFAGSLGLAGQAAAATGKTCANLQGTVITSTATVKIVSQPRNSSAFKGRVYLGCVRPSGRAFVIGRNGTSPGDGGTVTFTYARRALAGKYVVVSSSVDEGPGAFNTSTQRVFDLASGTARTFYTFTLAEGECTQENRTLGPPGRLVLGTNGILAGVFVSDDAKCFTSDDEKRIRVSVPGRPLATVDTARIRDIPSASLRLQGRVVSWTKAGQPMTFAG